MPGGVLVLGAYVHDDDVSAVEPFEELLAGERGDVLAVAEVAADKVADAYHLCFGDRTHRLEA
ncbi:MAG: hypothetical protein WD080_05040 [Egibacteraceae bacterium]